jgi:hypothetical protein
METLENTHQEPTMERSKWPDNPWLSIWIKPRATIRAIVDVDPERYVILLAVIAGIGEALNRASSKNLGDTLPILAILIIAAIFGAVGGVLSLYISGALLSWIGGMFGGQASAREVRTAIAWSSVPFIWSMAFWIPNLGLYGNEMFTSDTQYIDNFPLGVLIIGSLEVIIVIWTFIVYLKCLGEVHGFSAWKAFFVSIIPGFVLVILVFGCTLAAGSL